MEGISTESKIDLSQLNIGFLDIPSFPWKKLVVFFSLAQFTIETWLLCRQYRVYQRKTCPDLLAKKVTEKTFEESQAYSRAKAKFAFISSIWNELLSVLSIIYNLYPALWSVSGVLLARISCERFSGEISHSILFIFIFGLIQTVLGLPFRYYSTFILEERFGFNNMTVTLWIIDLLKEQALAIIFGVPLLSGFLAIIQKTGENFFYFIWIFIAVVQLCAITIYPIIIAPLFNKFTPLEAGTLKNAVEELAAEQKFPLSELQVIDGSKRSGHSNAFFTGLPWKKKIVIFDTLLKSCKEEEVVAVLAHELGHWKLGHTTKLLLISQIHIFYVFALFSAFIKNNSLFQSFGFYKQQPIVIGFLLFGEILSPTDMIVKFLMNLLTRKFEYQADDFAVSLAYGEDLGNALVELHVQNRSSVEADWIYSGFHHSHPIIMERLAAIKVATGKSSEELTDDKLKKP